MAIDHCLQNHPPSPKIHCSDDNQILTLSADLLQKALNVTPADSAHPFESPPAGKTDITFTRRRRWIIASQDETTGPSVHPEDATSTKMVGSNSKQSHVALAGPNPEHMQDVSVPLFPSYKDGKVRSKCENKGIVPTEMELVLEYTQQGASHEVSDHLKMEMEMEIPSSSNVKLITECSDTTYTCYEVMKDLIKVSKLPQTLISALHPKWRAKVTPIEESKDLTSLSLDELIGNLKAKKESSNEECSTYRSEDEEYAMAVRDFKKFFKRRECPKPPKDKNQRAFVEGSWSDSGEEDDEKVNNETCLVAQASSEVCSESSYFSDENSSIDDLVLDNEYDKLTAQNRCSASEIPGFKIRLYNKGGIRGYELPTSDILGGIVFEDGPNSRTDFDVIIEFRGGPPQRINKLHQSYMSLQFPLLFIFGQPGFYPDLVLKPRDGRGKGKKVSMNVYYKYQLHPRVKEFGLISRGGRLFQQYVVAVFCAIEQSPLYWVRNHQNDLRSDYLLGLYDVVSRGDREGIQAGSKIMLPRTFTGGPRYMYNHYLDALAICRSLGNPKFFITFTCNVKWPEIKRYMTQCPGLTPSDRADIVCRVFKQKVNDFLKILQYERPFGYVIACMVIS
ncbi:DNA helicase [Tanacetum coccineum]